MKRLILSLIAMGICLSGATAQDASQIIERARIAATLQNNDLQGKLEKRGGDKADVMLFLKGKNIQFQYSVKGRAWEIFHMRLGRDQYDLFSIDNGKTSQFPDSKLSDPVAGTDLSFEDLSLRFFYWPNPKLEGSESVKGEDCWKIRLNNPSKAGAYGVVYVWVHKKFGAFMKIRGHDRTGELRKEFLVDDIMRLPDGSYTLQKMKVASMSGGRTTGLSYLFFDKPKKTAPAGLR
ncbi:outer membrane lipoprotein-sorting protein [Haloferula chungangensis]|uniref:Outer membrane lipoprotein-sorting protein n=1 Tax=Haloferula chungangensis TaxID=1048331 RepID=A0ABW2L421_9BACT